MPSNMTPRTSFSTAAPHPLSPLSPHSALSVCSFILAPETAFRHLMFLLLLPAAGVAALVHFSYSISVSWAANTQICQVSKREREREEGDRDGECGACCRGCSCSWIQFELPLPPHMLISALNLLISDCDRDWRTCQFTSTHTHIHSHMCLCLCASDADCSVRRSVLHKCLSDGTSIYPTNFQAITWSTVQDYILP